jgi:hypothetical protein
MTAFSLVTEDQVKKMIQASNKTTSKVDPIPTEIFLKCIDILLPIVTLIINGSLRSGKVPTPLKRAIIRPLLKKPGLDATLPKNFRPVSNLSFVSKLLERAVSAQLVELLHKNKTLDVYQSAYRAGYSTETALLKVLNDLLRRADKGDVSLLLLLDLSAAFDTIDHDILITRLESEAGITDVCLQWFRSYLQDRQQCVELDGASSKPMLLTCGVPQGSVLGPILFCIYTAKLGKLIEDCGVKRQLFADDTGVYDSFAPNDLSVAAGVKKLEDCCFKIKDWMSANMLKLNEGKTEAILCGKKGSLDKVSCTKLTIAGQEVNLTPAVRNLGVVIDEQLNLQDHVSAIVKACNFKMRQFGRLRPHLTPEAAKMVAVALILSRLDYCNSCLWGINESEMQRLQVVQNTAARIVSRTRKRDHITPVLNDLHWLRVKHRVEHKTLSITYKCYNGTAPSYLSSLVGKHKLQTSMELRSTSQALLHVPGTKEVTNVRHGMRAFSNAGPKLWNEIPEKLRKSTSLSSFKKQLKTNLFLKQLA